MMNFVLGRVKRLRKTPFFKLISNYTLFEDIDIDLANQVPYSPDHNLDEDCWFKLENFKDLPFCLDILKKDIDSKSYDDLPGARFLDLTYLLAIQKNNVYFQKVTSSQFIKRKYLTLGEVVEVEECKKRLIVNEYPDAIYFKKEDILVFKNLATISSIFKGIDVLYKEATDIEVEDFLNSSFIMLKNQFCVDKVDKPNRKRIGLALDTLSSMSESQKELTLHYINDYCGHSLTYDPISGAIHISNNEDLKKLLYGIEQRFFTTHITKEKRLANSIITIQ